MTHHTYDQYCDHFVPDAASSHSTSGSQDICAVSQSQNDQKPRSGCAPSADTVQQDSFPAAELIRTMVNTARLTQETGNDDDNKLQNAISMLFPNATMAELSTHNVSSHGSRQRPLLRYPQAVQGKPLSFEIKMLFTAQLSKRPSLAARPPRAHHHHEEERSLPCA